MRFSMVKAIFKKEITYILRDKKTVLLGILLPMLLYPLMMIIFSQVMQSSVSDLPSKELNIAVKGRLPFEVESSIKEYKSSENGTFGKIKIVEVEDYDKAIAEEKILAYIDVSMDNKTYTIATNSSKTNSGIAYNTLEKIFKEYKDSKVNTALEISGLNPDDILNPVNYQHKEVAKTEEMAGSMIGSILPIILVASILVGVIYLSIDVMAGEKERGTLETLLTLPISNLEIVTGKYLAVSLSAIITAFCNILSIALTAIYLIGVASVSAEGVGLSSINYSSFVFAIIITVVCICLFAMVVSALTMCICSLAKSYKEAQNYVTPLTLGVLMLSYASLIPTVSLNIYTASIPFVNISLLIRDVLSLKIEPVFITLVLVSNLVLVMLSVILLSKMF
ncbi:MAG: ABC transporter permease subunit, partial [Clostridium sp.]